MRRLLPRQPKVPLPLQPAYLPASHRDRPSLRRRAGSLALAVALNLLLIGALIGLNARRDPPRFKGDGMTLVTVGREQAPAATRKPTARAQPKPSPPTPTPPAVRPPPLPMPSKNPLPFIEMSREDLAAADIAKLGTQGAAARGEQLASAAPGDSETVGTAPDGEPLYAAEWYRRPTDAELGGYLPRNMPAEGWGLIACKTAPRFRVEDCVELGNYPAGSHLAGAVRQAAWQFLVRPPRVGGKALVGTWVRIRIDYTTVKSAAN